jgi:hypothetical protein
VKSLAKLVLGVAVLVLLGGGIYLLREATMSTHYETGADSRLVTVARAAVNRPEEGVTLEQMAHAHFDLCALEVARVAEVERIPGRSDGFVITVQPSLDSTDRKQFRGCLQDWNVDHLQVHVESMSDEGGHTEGGGA